MVMPGKHKVMDHTEQMFKCEHCGKFFTSDHSLKAHIKNIHDPKQHKCSDCDKCFTTPAQARSHWQQEHYVDKQKCEICGSEFKNEYHLRHHFRKCSKPTGEWECPDCHMVIIGTADTINRHKLSHSTEFKCEYCDKSFATQKRLDNHTRQHTMEKDFNCNLCDKAFPSLDQIRQHCTTKGHKDKAEQANEQHFQQYWKYK